MALKNTHFRSVIHGLQCCKHYGIVSSVSITTRPFADIRLTVISSAHIHFGTHLVYTRKKIPGLSCAIIQRGISYIRRNGKWNCQSPILNEHGPTSAWRYVGQVHVEIGLVMYQMNVHSCVFSVILGLIKYIQIYRKWLFGDWGRNPTIAQVPMKQPWNMYKYIAWWCTHMTPINNNGAKCSRQARHCKGNQLKRTIALNIFFYTQLMQN